MKSVREAQLAQLREAIRLYDAVINDSQRRRAQLLERIRELTQPAAPAIGADDE